jgi:hypothetical protein
LVVGLGSVNFVLKISQIYGETRDLDSGAPNFVSVAPRDASKTASGPWTFVLKGPGIFQLGQGPQIVSAIIKPVSVEVVYALCLKNFLM